MVMLDANVILRYLLNDNDKMASEAEANIKNMPVQVNIEIVAEVVYHVARAEIRQCLLQFLSDVTTPEPEVLRLGIETYAEQSLDFPDCILYAYHKLKGMKSKLLTRS